MEQRSSNLEVYPLVRMENGWSIPDEVLIGIWAQIVREEKVKDLFYDGTINTEYEWMEFIKRPGTFPLLIVDKEKNTVVHIFWIKDCFDISAWIHHCGLGKYRRGAWEAARDHWRKYFPNLKMLLVITPESNTLTVKMLKMIKFVLIGKIPKICYMAYKNERVAGVIGYFEL